MLHDKPLPAQLVKYKTKTRGVAYFFPFANSCESVISRIGRNIAIHTYMLFTDDDPDVGTQ